MADDASKAGMALYLAKRYGNSEKGLKRLSDAQADEAITILGTSAPHKVEDITKHREELIKREDEVGEIARRAMVSKGTKQNEDGTFQDKDIQLMVDLGIKIDGEEIRELIRTKKGQNKVIMEAAFKKAVDALKREDIDSLSNETLNLTEFKQAAAMWKNWSFHRALGEEKGVVYLEKIQDAAEEKMDEVIKSNPSFVRAPYTTGGSLLMRPWKEIPNKKTVNEMIKKSKPRPRRPDYSDLETGPFDEKIE